MINSVHVDNIAKLLIKTLFDLLIFNKPDVCLTIYIRKNLYTDIHYIEIFFYIVPPRLRLSILDDSLLFYSMDNSI